MTPPASNRRAAIIGGSVAGLFAALLLRHHGWTVRVFERVPTPLSGRGAGIVTHPELVRILEHVGLDAGPDLGVPVTRRLVLSPAGEIIASFDCPQIMTGWDRLWRLLRSGLPDDCYQPGAEFTALEPGTDRVTAHFADGTQFEADLLVGADGIRSAVRTAITGDIPPLYAGYAAWRGLVEESAFPPDIHAALFDDFAFCLPKGEQMLGYPVAGRDNDLRPGHRRYNWVWYRPADETTGLPDLLTDPHGHTHTISIPPPLIRPELIARMRAAAHAILAPAFATIVAATETPFLQPIYDLESPRLASGRVALIGDSAFVARPHVGAGTTKAAEDALCLSELLDTTSIPEAVTQYELSRRPAGQRILRRARHLGAYMQAQQSTEEEQRAAARHHTPEAVLEETAVLTF